jgi:hypothetical protein
VLRYHPRANAQPPGNGAQTMAKKQSPKSSNRKVEQYEHTKEKRVNNPPVGLVTPDNDS